MRGTITIYDWESGDCDDDEITLVVPSKREVCDRCNGDGTHDHPAFSDGFTGSEWAEMCHDDPDWPEDYKRGVYDVACEECNGNKVVDVPDWDAMTPRQIMLAERFYQEEASFRAEAEAERRMGA